MDTQEERVLDWKEELRQTMGSMEENTTEEQPVTVIEDQESEEIIEDTIEDTIPDVIEENEEDE